jgi:iron complex outermembrane recepter protein
MKKSIWIGLLSAVAAQAMIFSMPTVAQTKAAEPANESVTEIGLDEIVVTARRREENLQDTPISITSLSGADLAASGAKDASDIGRAAPNVTFLTSTNSGGTSAFAGVFIRGIGQDDFLPTADPGVGIYLDEVYLGRASGGALRLNDVSSIQVLRGPQGTLFGRNTVGGAVLVVSNKPELGKTTGKIELGYGSDDLVEAGFVANAPLSEKAALRISGQGVWQDGYARSTSNPALEFGKRKEFNMRAQLLVEPAENMHFILAGDYMRQRNTNVPGVALADTAFGTPPSGLGTLYNGFVAPGSPTGFFTPANLGSLDPIKLGSNGKINDDADVWGISLTGDIELSDAVNLKLITSYRDMDANFASDNDGTVHRIAQTDDYLKQQQFSQEIQLSGKSDKLQWIVGAYYFREIADDFNSVSVVPGSYNAVEALPVNLPTGPGAPVPCALQSFTPIPGTPFRAPPPGFGLGCANNIANTTVDIELDVTTIVKSRNFAGYGQLTYNLTDALSVTAGLRYTYEKKDFIASTLNRAVSAKLGGPFYSVGPFTDKKSWSEFTPKFGIEYKASDGVLAFASYSRGFKSGTFNGRATDPVALGSVDPETVDAFELGAKADLLDRRLRINGAIFYNKYSDIQLVVTATKNNQLINQVLNAAKADIYGGELEITALPVDGLTLNGSLGYAKSEIKELSPTVVANSSIRVGNELKKTPEWTWSLGATYTVPLAIGDVSGRVSYASQGKIFHDPGNSGQSLERAYGLLDASLGLKLENPGITVSVYGQNLANKTYAGTIFLSGGGTTVFYAARGRQLGVRASYSF